MTTELEQNGWVHLDKRTGRTLAFVPYVDPPPAQVANAVDGWWQPSWTVTKFPDAETAADTAMLDAYDIDPRTVDEALILNTIVETLDFGPTGLTHAANILNALRSRRYDVVYQP